jgi:hypothetical protein
MSCGTIYFGRVRTSPDTPPERRKIIEDAHESARERLLSDLNALRQAAGNPSLGHLVKLSQRKLSKSTLNDHLKGRRTLLPPWRLVSAYISACHEAAGSTGLDVGRLGTLDEWLSVYKAAVEGKIWGTSPLRSSGDTMSFDTSSLAEPDEAPPEDVDETRTRSSPIFRYEDKISKYADLSIAPIIRRFEDELPDVAKSLSPYAGTLIITGGAAIGTRFSIEHNITTIGRDPESDAWLNDATVSRRHAVIRRYGDRFFVDDTGSTNGTYHRESLVERESSLQSYEELHIGIFSLLFVQGGTAPDEAMEQSYHAIRSRLARGLTVSTSPQGWPGLSLRPKGESPPDAITPRSVGTRWPPRS